VTNPLYDAIYQVARVLEVPVVILALLALAFVIVEIGRYLVESVARRQRRHPGRSSDTIASGARAARRDLAAGDANAARRALAPVARSAAMDDTLDLLVAHAGGPEAEARMAKDLADFDFESQRKLARTRLLVRAGPALGLMGTLIPLAPALDGLANGNVAALTNNLRVAFSVTVLGLLVGAVAFGLSLVRDRLYGQDYSDLEFVAAILTATGEDPKDSDLPVRSRPEVRSS
jgi:biopolymer transport protein ExbB/TolQ